MDISEQQIGELISEGKTKQVYSLKKNGFKSPLNDLVYIANKDNISAGDASRNRRLMEGKGRITAETSSAIFQFLNAVGVKTAFVSRVKNCENAFIAKHCLMIPIEIVIRRIATGTYLKLNPDVSEGFRFISPVIEIHIKDDKNHDPLWSIETLIAQQFKINGLSIDRKIVDIILKLGKLVFEILERVWHTIDYQLVDLKVEFGVISDENQNKSLVLADIIDNETWRLWPYGDKRLMVDKQIYRVYKEGEVDNKVIDYVRSVFQKVSDLTQQVFNINKINREFIAKEPVIVVTNSENNTVLAQEFIENLESDYDITGAKIIQMHGIKENSIEFQKLLDGINQSYCQVIVTIGATHLNALTLNTAIPVVNYFDENINANNGNGFASKTESNTCITVAKIIAVNNVMVWSRLKTNRCYASIQ